MGEATGRLIKGWATALNGNKYYTIEGVIQTGDKCIDGNWYRFDNDGKLKNNWVYNLNGNTYYFYSNSVKATGLVKIADKRYLFSSDGRLLISDCKAYIDISSAQTIVKYNNNTSSWEVDIDSIDWDSLKNSGQIDGILLKAGSGSETSGKWYQINLDFFRKAINKCEELSIPYGVYWYSYAEVYNNWDNHEAINEANLFIDRIRNYVGNNFKLGVYWDLEENRDVYQNNIMISEFMNIMHNNGIDAKIYCNKYFANNILYNFSSYITWVSHYTGSQQSDESWSKYPNRLTEYTGWKIWQYTDAESVAGINGYVDMSVAVW